MRELSRQDVLDLFSALAEKMPCHQERLRELDASLGDGDLGVTMSLGMRAIADGLPDLAGQDVGAIIARSGMNFNRAAASTFGAIFASGLMRAGQAARGKQSIEVADLPVMCQAAIEGIMQRGGAKPGEKTVLDVLGPMAEALKVAAESGADMVGAVQAAHKACQEGLEATKQMEGTHGRAGWFKDRSLGIADPGSTAICLMVDCWRRFVEGRSLSP